MLKHTNIKLTTKSKTINLTQKMHLKYSTNTVAATATTTWTDWYNSSYNYIYPFFTSDYYYIGQIVVVVAIAGGAGGYYYYYYSAGSAVVNSLPDPKPKPNTGGATTQIINNNTAEQAAHTVNTTMATPKPHTGEATTQIINNNTAEQTTQTVNKVLSAQSMEQTSQNITTIISTKNIEPAAYNINEMLKAKLEYTRTKLDFNYMDVLLDSILRGDKSSPKYIKLINNFYEGRVALFLKKIEKSETSLTPELIDMARKLCHKVAFAATDKLNGKSITLLNDNNVKLLQNLCETLGIVYDTNTSEIIDTIIQATPQILEVASNINN